MSLLNIQGEIDKLFLFERNISSCYQSMRIAYRQQRAPATNVELKSEYLGLCGYCEHYHIENQGVVIYEYAMDRVIRKTGAAVAEPMTMLQDCEHHYYGLKLNCLAYFSGQRIKSLVLRDVYNGNSIGIRYNAPIAEKFLASIVPPDSSRSRDLKINPRQQFALFSR